MGVISADGLYQLISSSDENYDQKSDGINDLKAFVKKDFVDVDQAPKYFEALSIAVDITNQGISVNAFSTLSHLVKRISMQEPNGTILKKQSYLVLPIIIGRLGDSKGSTRNAARKALEAYWFSAPKEVEDAIMDISLKHRNSAVVKESVVWLHHIIKNVSPHFKLTPFIPDLVRLLAVYNSLYHEDIIEVTKALLTDYYSMKHNRLYKFDLIKELDNQKVSGDILDYFVQGPSLDKPSRASNHPPRKNNVGENNFVLAGSTRVTVGGHSNHKHEQAGNNTSLTSDKMTHNNPAASAASTKPGRTEEEVKKSLPNMHGDSEIRNDKYNAAAELDPELEKLVLQYNYKIDDSIQPLRVDSPEHLYDMFNAMLPAFDGKETEFNWGAREKKIIELRSIIRGNSSWEYSSDLVVCLRELSDGICKGMSSLRTTLCSHTCHFVKECAIILKEKFDPLFDLFHPTLSKLCSSTKHISSSNANMAICAMFINSSYNHKLLMKILSASADKNVQPRSYSAVWLQIILLRFSELSAFLSYNGNIGMSGTDACSKVLMKLLADPNPNVRQTAKDAYWCFWSKFPSKAGVLLSKLDAKVVKGIGRSKPTHLSSNSVGLLLIANLNSKKSRPSIREAILSRNKELKTKQKDSRELSRPVSRINSAPPLVVDTGVSADHPDIHISGNNGGPHHATRSFSNPHVQNLELHKNHQKPVRASRVYSPIIAVTKNEEKTSAENEESVEKKDDDAENYETNDLSYEKEKDPILKFLSSDQPELIAEGVTLLKYAIMGEEDLDKGIIHLLRDISIKKQDLLKPLFMGTDQLFRKSSSFFAPDDFLRICFIVRQPFDERTIDLIISTMSVDQVYSSLIKLVSLSTNIGNIVDDNNLTMQIIRYKSTIIGLVINFMNRSLDKIPISDTHFMQILGNLLELVDLLKSTGIYESFSHLLKKMHSINPTIFESELLMLPSSAKEEIEYVVGIDGILDLGKDMTTTNIGSMFDLTKVIPDNNLGKISPLKAPSDLTMLMPVVKGPEKDFVLESQKNIAGNAHQQNTEKSEKENLSEAFEEKHDLLPFQDGKSSRHTDIESANDSMQIDRRLSNIDTDKKANQSHSGMSDADAKLDIASMRDEESRSFFLESDNLESVKLNYENGTSVAHSGYSNELADNFAQVKITEKSRSHSNNNSTIQSFIEKVDPLNRISNKNRPITIYSDSKKGSPQKVREYSYNDLNWFNFQLARVSTHRAMSSNDHFSITSFGVLCDRMMSSRLEEEDVVHILNYIRKYDHYDQELRDYFDKEGIKTLEKSLLCYFLDRSGISDSDWVHGLIILKQLFVSRIALPLESTWDILLRVSSASDILTDDLYEALGEVFDEILTGVYSTKAILSVILNSIASFGSDTSLGALCFSFESLYKLLSVGSLTLIINSELISQIDMAIHEYLNSPEVEVRRYVVLTYGRLLKSHRSAKHFDENDVNTEDSMESIMLKFTVPQKKLIEYYSRL